jgi:F-type H+-transporting ATPase subunit delta
MASAVANRYARALVGVVTKPGAPATPDSTATELGAFLGAFRSSADLRNVLLSPAVAPQKKKNLLASLGARLGFSRSTQNFLYVVTDHRRLNLLGEMLAAFESLLDERLGVVRASVTTAQPADRDQQAALTGKLSERTGRRVRATFGADSRLLGGVVVRIGSTIYDGSVKGRLAALQRRLGAE